MADNDNANWGRVAGLGLEMAVGVGLGFGAGLWIDKKWNSGPWGVLIGSMVGLASGMYLLIKGAIKANRVAVVRQLVHPID